MHVSHTRMFPVSKNCYSLEKNSRGAGTERQTCFSQEKEVLVLCWMILAIWGILEKFLIFTCVLHFLDMLLSAILIGEVTIKCLIISYHP